MASPMGSSKARQRKDTTVRLDRETAMKVAKMAEDAHVSKQRVLTDAVENLRRQWLLEQTNAAYAALRANPEEMAALAEERALYEGALGDILRHDADPV